MVELRVCFNPSNNGLVDVIKQRTAELINLCEENRADAVNETSYETSSEEARCWSLAMTYYEDAAMWAVKAATAGK